jgi:hypothetical protein
VYTVEMGSGAMIYIPGFGIQNLMRGHTQIHRQRSDLINLLPFFQNKKKWLQI